MTCLSTTPASNSLKANGAGQIKRVPPSRNHSAQRGPPLMTHKSVYVSADVREPLIDTLSKTTPSTGRGGQFFQLISLLLGNTYELKELAATSC